MAIGTPGGLRLATVSWANSPVEAGSLFATQKVPRCIGIVRYYLYPLEGLQVDPDGKFCYGRLTLVMIISMRSGIPPRLSTGVRCTIDFFTILRR
jgi:hypothetical protein